MDSHGGLIAARIISRDTISRCRRPIFLLLTVLVLSLAFPDFAYKIFIAGQIIPPLMAWLGLAMLFLDLFEKALDSDSTQAESDRPDPKKWHFDRNSGEYFRIKGHHKGYVIYDKTPYSWRLMADYNRIVSRRKDWKETRKFAIILVASLVFVKRDFTPDPRGLITFNGWTIFAIMAVLVSGLGVLHYVPSLFPEKPDIGPEPVAPRGLEEVEEQKAYGDATPADIASIHNALSGNAASASSAVAGSRRPLFDE